MGQRPSFSHLTGYPEAVASAQDFAPYGHTEATRWDYYCTTELYSEATLARVSWRETLLACVGCTVQEEVPKDGPPGQTIPNHPTGNS